MAEQIDKGDTSKRRRAGGTIVPKGSGKWLVRLYAGTNPATGRRMYRSQLVRGTKAEAKRALVEMQRAKVNRTLAGPTSDTVGEYLLRWLDTTKAQRVCERTLRHYRYLATHYIVPQVGAIRLQRLTADQVQEYVVAPLAERVSPRTVRMAVGLLSQAMKAARGRGVIPQNPVELCELPAGPRPEMHALAAADVRRLLEATKASPLHALFLLAVDTGARPGELLALRWADVDLAEGTLRIERTLFERVGVKGAERFAFAPTKTPRSRRTLVLSPESVAVLRAHRVAQARRLVAGLELIFTTEQGTPYQQSNVRQAFLRAGIHEPGKVGLHALLRTWLSTLLDRGIPLHVTQKLGGWADSATVLRHCAVAGEEEQRRAAAVMEGLLTHPLAPPPAPAPDLSPTLPVG
jgi:integrase